MKEKMNWTDWINGLYLTQALFNIPGMTKKVKKVKNKKSEHNS